MKLLYIAFKDFSNLHFGANAKVLSQCRAFEEYGYEVELIGRKGSDTVVISPRGESSVVSRGDDGFKNPKLRNLQAKHSQMKAVCQYIKEEQYEACYIRYDFSDAAFIKMLRCINQHCRKVVLELPTYPYEAENSIGVLNKIKMQIDFHYRKELKKYIDFIVTFYEGHEELFGIPVEVIPNGFDFSTMDMVHTELPEDAIHIIAVSSMREWHGYERMIEGMRDYYAKNGNENFVLHLVGNGREYGKYKELSEKYGLQSHVIMEGAMHGEKLDALYEKCALGVDSLARHRSGISVLSSLKSREYGAKGIPIINSCKIDIIENDFPYLLQVPADESPIDMEKISDFFKECYKTGETREKIAGNIREYIFRKSSMKATLESIVRKCQECGDKE